MLRRCEWLLCIFPRSACHMPQHTKNGRNTIEFENINWKLDGNRNETCPVESWVNVLDNYKFHKHDYYQPIRTLLAENSIICFDFVVCVIAQTHKLRGKKKQIWNSNLNAALCLKNAINYFIFAPTGTNLMSMYSWFTQSHVHIFVFYIIFFCLFVFDISRKFRQLVTDKWTLWNSKNELKRIHRNAMMCPK